MKQRLQHSWQTLAPFVLLPLLLGSVGCSHMGNQPEEVVRGEDMARTQPAKALKVSRQEADDFLYNLLAGEFAGVRGDLQTAVEYYSRVAEKNPSQEVLGRAAYIALYAGDDRAAADLCERWYALGYPESPDIERIRIMAYLHLRKLEPVVEAIEKQLMVDGDVNEPIVSTLTHILNKEAQPDFALDIIQVLNQKYPDSPLLLLMVSRFQANLGRFDAALANVQRLIELDPELVDAYLVRAQVLAGMNQEEAAVQAIEIVVQKRPEDRRLRLQFARMLVQFRHFDKAIAHFLELKKLMPDDENVLLSLGLLSIETGEYMQAKQYLQELIDKGYRNEQAHYYLGRIQQNEGEDMPAIANYERVNSGEYWLDARIRSASLLARSGKTDKALKQLETLYARESHSESNRIKLYLARGEVLRNASRNREAYKLYNAALVQSPENTDLLYARALTAEKLNMLDVAESDLKMVIMHEPENASALNALGYTLADRTKRYEEARDYILKAAQLLPDDPAILDSLGWVYYRLGQYEDALKWLNKAFAAQQDAEIAAHLGEVLWVIGKTEEAINIWEKGRELDGNQAVLRDTIQRFK